jgi:holo-[acyl-carrier protein] synthase
MIVGIGGDIFEVARMRCRLEEPENGFKSEIFTPLEISYCESKRHPERHYAARFAAKEALFKALSSGMIDGMAWRDVEVRNDSQGRPYLVLTGKTKESIELQGVGRVLVTLSHTGEWAMANVVLESRDTENRTQGKRDG